MLLSPAQGLGSGLEDGQGSEGRYWDRRPGPTEDMNQAQRDMCLWGVCKRFSLKPCMKTEARVERLKTKACL